MHAHADTEQFISFGNGSCMDGEVWFLIIG